MSTAEKHRSAYLTLAGDGPGITKLPESRWQVTYRCSTQNPKTDWWKENQSRIFADYGTLATAGLPVGAVTAQANIHLDDLRLVDLRGAPPEQADRGYNVILVYETLKSTWALEDADKDSTTENGLKIRTRSQVATPGTALPTLMVGTTESAGLILAGKEDDSNDRRARVVTRWAEPGILDADPVWGKDGILYVTFISQGTRIRPTALAAGKTLTDDPNEAFIGGAEAPLFRNRIRNVSGFRQYITTVMLKHDGSVLTSGSQVKSRKEWLRMRFPGEVSLSFASGIVPIPGSSVWVRVTVTETATTNGDVGDATVPWSIKRGAYAHVAWTPADTGIRQSISRAFGENFLGGVGLAGNNTTWLGEPATSVAGTVGSSPPYHEFLNTETPVLSREIMEDMTTDEGVQWYRIRQVQLIGTFGSYTGAATPYEPPPE